MGKYRTAARRPDVKVARPQHPIWRGIGCMIIIIVPLISFAIAYLTLPFFFARGLVPYQLTGIPQAPEILWKFLPRLAGFVQRIIGFNNLKAYLTLTLVYTVFLGGILSLVYAVIYRFFGPSRYGPMDAPPQRGRVKKYTR